MTAHLSGLLQDALGPDYRLEQELEGGGMSRLFLTTDLRHNRRVVVKVLSPELMSTQSTARFKREIELTVRLQHPHILPVLTSGAWEDVLYYITPFIPGESLRDRLVRERKLPLDDIVKILRDVSGALAFAHQRGIVHRDVKPGNILLAEGHAILADFGIARAVSTNATPLTGSGMTPGTPAYMAPELPTDEKADVYALGVVAYEMLCGELPSKGVTAKEIVGRRGKVVGDDPRRLADLVALVQLAISHQLEHRVGSAQEFCEELEALNARRPWRAMVPAMVAVGAVAVGVAAFVFFRSPPVVADRYAIVGAANDSLGMVSALRQALGEWGGVSIVEVSSPASVNDDNALQRSAKRAGAQYLVLLEGSRQADSIALSETLRDVRTNSRIRTRRLVLPRSAPQADRVMAFRRLANAIVRTGDLLPWVNASDTATPSLAAWRDYDAGHEAIAAWQLARAESAFVRAVRSEPGLDAAQLWLAQTIQWEDVQRAEEVKTFAMRALNGHRVRSTSDSLQAIGLLSVAQGDFPKACDAFGRMRDADSASISAWIGLGDCNALDKAVVPEPQSLSGRVFRGSFEAAARAYQRAADFGPVTSSGEFQESILGRLSLVLHPITNWLRLGRSIGDSLTFAAVPYLAADTLAFAPVPVTQLAKLPFSLDPTAIRKAAEHSRVLMRRSAEDWVRRSPTRAASYIALAGWAEVSGGQAMLGDRQVNEVEVVRQALKLPGDSIERIQLGILEVRFLLKAGNFNAARATADSLLRSGAADHLPLVDGVQGLAIILGRVNQAAELLTHDREMNRIVGVAKDEIAIPEQLLRERAKLLAYAAAGVPGDSIPAIARRIDRLVASYFPDSAEARAVREAVLLRSLTLAYPTARAELAATPASAGSGLGMMRSLASGDTAQARAQLLQAQKLRVGSESGNSFDMNLRRSMVALALADTASAIEELDPVLNALPTLSPRLLSEVSFAAALVRAFVLRAEVAAAQHDKAAASQWAKAVVALWAHADPQVTPILNRMRALMY